MHTTVKQLYSNKNVNKKKRGNDEHIMDTGGKVILVIKQQKTWLSYVLPLGGK